jgi:pimeloyl-ACP methyl ester carboxylesterase
MGFPSLVVTYRNDPQAEPNPDRRFQYGRTEWRDLDSAAAYATARGAEGFVLVGYSMGGAVVLNFMVRSLRASRVLGLILEAPPVELEATVDHGLTTFLLPVVQAPLPPVARAAAKALAEVRFGLRWSAFDLTDEVRNIRVPILLLHGDQDPVVPLTESLRLAASRPGLVTLERYSQAGHVECWNVDSVRYTRELQGFLNSVAGRDGTAPGPDGEAPVDGDPVRLGAAASFDR